MEHRRIASFGVYFLLVAGTPALAAASGEQSAKGPYRGSYVCQAKLGAPGIFEFRSILLSATATSNLPDRC